MLADAYISSLGYLWWNFPLWKKKLFFLTAAWDRLFIHKKYIWFDPGSVRVREINKNGK